MIITNEAQTKIKDLIVASQDAVGQPLFLRVTVMPGGCSGLKHQTYFDYETRVEDRFFKFDGFDLRIDEESYSYLEGAILDYSDTIEKQGFFIDNPNAESVCGCGESFH